jgi:tetratricopeptide (TPR) repeat protein
MRLVPGMMLLAFSAVWTVAQSDNTELQQIGEMTRRCREESVRFRDTGGQPGDPGDPALKWSAALWQYGKDHPRTAAGIQATSYALTWLRHADQDAEVLARARTLPSDFSAWGSVVDGLRQSSVKTGDYTTFFEITRRLLAQPKNKPHRASVHLALGRVYEDQNQPDRALAAFRAVLKEAPNSPQADDAELLLHEMKNLRVGQTIPDFEAVTIDGKRITPAALRGKVVLLNFWATW